MFYPARPPWRGTGCRFCAHLGQQNQGSQHVGDLERGEENLSLIDLNHLSNHSFCVF